MNEYRKILKEVRDAKCPSCQGTGKTDYADPDDTFCIEWTCQDCFGTGFKNGQFSIQRVIDKIKR